MFREAGSIAPACSLDSDPRWTFHRLNVASAFPSRFGTFHSSVLQRIQEESGRPGTSGTEIDQTWTLKWVCLKMLCTPTPNGLWSLSLLNGYNWGYTPFSDILKCACNWTHKCWEARQGCMPEFGGHAICTKSHASHKANGIFQVFAMFSHCAPWSHRLHANEPLRRECHAASAWKPKTGKTKHTSAADSASSTRNTLLSVRGFSFASAS